MLQAKLVVVGGEAQSQEVKLKLPAVIGRGKEATLKVPLALVSRRHCEIRERDGRLYIRDLGSLNGTYVNNYKITAEQPLLPGELVTVGSVTFRAEYPLHPQATAPPAAKRDPRSKRVDAGTASKPAVVFTPLSSPGRELSARATPQFDSTVAGTMSVSVSPGQPVQIEESLPAPAAEQASSGVERSHSSVPPAQQSLAAKKSPAKSPRRFPPTANRPLAGASPNAARPVGPAQPPTSNQPRPQSADGDGGLVLDDFPLELAPQKSISLSSLDELAVAGPRQVSFIGDLSFGDQPRPTVDTGVSIDLGSAVQPNQLSSNEADSRLDSFLRGIEQPAD